jgi:hypothetical protein
MTPTKTGIAGTHLVRYSTPADQKYLLGPFLETYDQLVLNANMLAHASLAISGFLSQQAKKPYFIDPQTHAFQHGREYLLSESKSSKGLLKKSWAKLVDAYGEPFQSAIVAEERSVNPGDFNSAATIRAMCDRVCLFQLKTVTKQLTDTKDSKYLKFVSKVKGLSLTEFPPSLLIPPYFYLEAETYEAWLEINLQCLHEFFKVAPTGVPVAAQIVLSRELLSKPDARARILAAYQNGPKPTLFLLWVDGLTEHAAKLDELLTWHKFLTALSAIAPVVNLYGGYLSTLLARFVHPDHLLAVCHGIEHSEMRAVVPVGGGVPVAKYYLPALHHRLSSRPAIKAMRALNAMTSPKKFFAHVCDCPQCQAVIITNPEEDVNVFFTSKSSSFWRGGRWVTVEFPTGAASDLCTKHYMYCKASEYKESGKLAELVDALQQAGTKLYSPLGDLAGHTETWPKFLSAIKAI